MNIRLVLQLLFGGLLCVSSALAESPAATPRVYFKQLNDGAVVQSPLTIEMGVEGMTVGKAGAIIAGEGHHHLIVDGAPVKEGEVVIKDESHLHFGNAQEEATVELTPGKHTLTLQFADGAHRSYGPQMAATITVEVQG